MTDADRISAVHFLRQCQQRALTGPPSPKHSAYLARLELVIREHSGVLICGGVSPESLHDAAAKPD